jgi:CheY-like chemotaxis protein
MTAEIAARAFDPFFSTKEIGKGSGLGLSMVYGFVKQSGGHTELDSVEGEGSRFRIYLPRVRAVRLPAADTDTPDTVAEMPSRGESVLVVEDDADVRSLTAAQLTGLGYAVIEAPDADEAMSFLGSTDRIDLLLTDVVLPGIMSGMELAVEARRRRPDVKVVYMSGYAEDVLARDDELNDGIELLQKPFRKVDLAQKVHSALHGTAVEDGAIEDR